MKIEEIIKKLKILEEPFILDPYIDDHGEGVENLVGYITQLREDIEESQCTETIKPNLLK